MRLGRALAMCLAAWAGGPGVTAQNASGSGQRPSPLQPLPPPFFLSGTPCSNQLENMGEYEPLGRTASGAPFFRLRSQLSRYMFWDPDCGTNAIVRWIIDSDEPSTTATKDLDGDGKCSYKARINASDSSHPPLGSHTWTAWCGEDDGGWTSEILTIAPPPPAAPPLPPSSPGEIIWQQEWFWAAIGTVIGLLSLMATIGAWLKPRPVPSSTSARDVQMTIRSGA